MVGEEKGVEDKAEEMRAHPCEPWKGPPPCHTVGARQPPHHGETLGHLSPFTSNTAYVTSGRSRPLWASKTAGFSQLGETQLPGIGGHLITNMLRDARQTS